MKKQESKMTRTWLWGLLLLVALFHHGQGFSLSPTLAARTSLVTPLTRTQNAVSRRAASTILNLSATNESSSSNNNNPKPQSLRCRLRQATGFSLTAFRATMRGITGISLTAVYASALAATSAFVRKTMALILSPLPPWFRYFLQPFLILYYAPLFILRNLAGPTGKHARESHELFVDGFKSAVHAAERKADGYWPVHLTEEGDIVSVEPPSSQQQQQSTKQIDVNEGIAQSVEVALEDEDDATRS